MIWFTSDTHFWHANIIRYCNRPFSCAEEMNEVMIENWNACVRAVDIVRHLGDFGRWWGNAADLYSVRKRLNGQIHLIRGNHDENIDPTWFESVKHYDEIQIDGQKIVLFHYALRTWHHDLRGTWHLFGHSHGALPGYGKSFDIGVDCWGFHPVSFDEVKAKMDTLEISAATPRFSCRDCNMFPCVCEDNLVAG